MITLQPGHLLQDGKYSIVRTIGQGGFGITYLAYQKSLDTYVCIKEFFFENFCNRDQETYRVTVGTESSRHLIERFKQKFLKEARTISRLHHTNIVRVNDTFEENGTAYYIMEHIDGCTLTDIIRNNGPIPTIEALACIQQIGSALSYIHHLNLNHLDVKPSNIMRRNSDGAYILIDFGLAKQYDSETGGQTSTTPVGISKGYAPIEQYRTGGVSEFSPQTDIYSLGATFYYLLTGTDPDEASVLISSPLSFPNEIPPEYQYAIIEAMRPVKHERPATVESFLALLPPNHHVFKPVAQPGRKKKFTSDTTIVNPQGTFNPISDKTRNALGSNIIKLLSLGSILGILAWLFCTVFWDNHDDKDTITNVSDEQDSVAIAAIDSNVAVVDTPTIAHQPTVVTPQPKQEVLKNLKKVPAQKKTSDVKKPSPPADRVLSKSVPEPKPEPKQQSTSPKSQNKMSVELLDRSLKK